MKKNSAFEKFLPKKKNSVIKEEARQFKKKVKKERAVAIDKRKAETRAQYAVDKTQRRLNPNQAAGSKPVIIKAATDPGIMPLNKFIAHCGVVARREAAALVRQGKVKVNGELILEPGHKVSVADDIKVAGKKVFLAKNLVYILVNKPKDYITTSDDPQGRKTILDLIKGATPERVFPVGRLDRNTTGVLLLTNDGELTQKLTHPSFEVKKIYEVTLDKPVTKADFDKILAGMELEDGFIRADAMAYTDKTDHHNVGIEIHSGRNRIVRRIFEALGYDVRNLDRVMFANLTKKNVERGKWRFLNEKEVRLLKYMNSSFIRKNKVGSEKVNVQTDLTDFNDLTDMEDVHEMPAPPKPAPRDMSADPDVDLAQLWEKKRGGKPIPPPEEEVGNDAPREKRPYVRKEAGAGSARRVEKPFGERKTYPKRDDKPFGERKPYAKREDKPFGERKPYAKRDDKPFGERKTYAKRDDKPFGERKPYAKREDKPFGERKPYAKRDDKPFGERKTYSKRDDKPFGERKAYPKRDDKPFGERKTYPKRDGKPFGERKAYGPPSKGGPSKGGGRISKPRGRS